MSEDVLQTVIWKCEGNPLVSLNFLFNLLTNGFLYVKDQWVRPNESFEKCKAISDWAAVPVPGLSLKVNSTLIDSFLKEMRQKNTKIDLELSM